MQEFIMNVLRHSEFQSVRLLNILHQIQAEFRCIPEAAIATLAQQLKINKSQIVSVIEFYRFFHLQPRAHYAILLSDSITDQMMGKQALMDYFTEQLSHEIKTGIASLDNTSCTGLCDQGPAGLINGYALPRLTQTKIDEIVTLIKQEKPLSEWPANFFSITDNIHKTGLLLSAKTTPGEAIKNMFKQGIEQALLQIQQSGLRGRGGAGFSTALKWTYCKQTNASERYVVCNADEGEPGTFKDRVLLNSYAHQVFDGMTVCAAIINAKQGFLYLRAEYLHLYQPLQQILQQRRELGLLGHNIFNQGFEFDIEIRLGAGAYICGEESALIESLEGKRGIPRIRPPFPVTQGYLNQPTVVDNVETFVAASYISVHGADQFNQIGTPSSTGTKLLSISGDCQLPGIYEYPFGTTINEILADCGAEEVLGVQIGGPSGTFISPQEFDRQLGFEDLSTGGSLIIFNNKRAILKIVQNFSHFFAHESCGFCTPCREGTTLLATLIDNYCQNTQSPADKDTLLEMSQLMKSSSHCGLGQTAANPILTTLQRYPELYQ